MIYCTKEQDCPLHFGDCALEDSTMNIMTILTSGINIPVWIWFMLCGCAGYVLADLIRYIVELASASSIIW